RGEAPVAVVAAARPGGAAGPRGGAVRLAAAAPRRARREGGDVGARHPRRRVPVPVRPDLPLEPQRGGPRRHPRRRALRDLAPSRHQEAGRAAARVHGHRADEEAVGARGHFHRLPRRRRRAGDLRRQVLPHHPQLPRRHPQARRRAGVLVVVAVLRAPEQDRAGAVPPPPGALLRPVREQRRRRRQGPGAVPGLRPRRPRRGGVVGPPPLRHVALQVRARHREHHRRQLRHGEALLRAGGRVGAHLLRRAQRPRPGAPGLLHRRRRVRVGGGARGVREGGGRRPGGVRRVPRVAAVRRPGRLRPEPARQPRHAPVQALRARQPHARPPRAGAGGAQRHRVVTRPTTWAPV
uniref:Uncharacterized protein n=1 Tax=Oryza glumipatula TaxID=40148 RepID=A0A0D9ZKY0_9ORYZ